MLLLWPKILLKNVKFDLKQANPSKYDFSPKPHDFTPRAAYVHGEAMQ
jgi:hypothetical protein